jgi:hypothetical protein
VPDGPEGVRRLVELYRAAFPDIEVNRIADGKIAES